MFWNKIPKGYVETVDGYIVKESECKKIVNGKTSLSITGGRLDRPYFYRKEQAPAYESVAVDSLGGIRFFSNLEVNKDGTPIGYYSKEEVEKLEAEIKKLKEFIAKLDETNINLIDENVELQFEIKDLKKKKKGRGRPNGSKNKK